MKLVKLAVTAALFFGAVTGFAWDGTQGMETWKPGLADGARTMSAQEIIFRGLNFMGHTEGKSPIGINEAVKCHEHKREVNGRVESAYRCDLARNQVIQKDAEALYGALYHAVINGLPVTIRGYDYIVSDGETFLICEDRYLGHTPFKHKCTFY